MLNSTVVEKTIAYMLICRKDGWSKIKL